MGVCVDQSGDYILSRGIDDPGIRIVIFLAEMERSGTTTAQVDDPVTFYHNRDRTLRRRTGTIDDVGILYHQALERPFALVPPRRRHSGSCYPHGKYAGDHFLPRVHLAGNGQARQQ